MLKIIVMKNLSKQSKVKSISSVILLSLLVSFSLSAQAILSSAKAETEAPLKLEAWMSSLEEFNYSDSELEIEEWMTDLSSFYTANSESKIVVECWMTNIENFENTDESPLLVEAWMTSLNAYNNENYDTLLFAEEVEPALEVENWMTSISHYTNTPTNSIESIKDVDFENNAPILIALKY